MYGHKPSKQHGDRGAWNKAGSAENVSYSEIKTVMTFVRVGVRWALAIVEGSGLINPRPETVPQQQR